MSQPHNASSIVARIQCSTEQDVDDIGVEDPSHDDSLHVGPDEDLDDADDANDLETGNPITALRSLGADDGEPDLELDAGILLGEVAAFNTEDDQDGPAEDMPLPLEPAPVQENRDLDEVEGIDGEVALPTLQEIDWQKEAQDETDVMVLEAPGDDVNDLTISWTSQPWLELKLRSAFTPRNSLSARRNILVAAGDAVDIVSLDDFSQLDPIVPTVKCRCAHVLDANCRLILIITSTGQLMVWNRVEASYATQPDENVARMDHAVQVWSTPTDSEVWIRLASGQLMRTRSVLDTFEPVAIPGRCVAIDGSDDAALCLVDQGRKLSLLALRADGANTIVLPEDLANLALARDIILVTLGEIIIVGARGHGLWLSTDGGSSFHKAPGCRYVTACVVGQFSGRLYAWAALFLELEDRAELVGIDLRTMRSHKVAEFRVMADSHGPEDDPPERARIDCLLWDSARQRMLAAGCFGLACFVPPHSTHPTS